MTTLFEKIWLRHRVLERDDGTTLLYVDRHLVHDGSRAAIDDAERRVAEAEGLDRVFTQAGFQWRHAGCSMCIGTNGDLVARGQRCASTSNRNFVGRQGPGLRTHVMSPAMAATAAATGRLTDVRTLP